MKGVWFLNLHEDNRNRKVMDMHGNNLDSDDVMLDTITHVTKRGFRKKWSRFTYRRALLVRLIGSHDRRHHLELSGPRESSGSLCSR